MHGDERPEPDYPEIRKSGNPDIDSLNLFHRLLSNQDERGLALSLAAFAEETLGRLLLTYLADCKQSRELVEGFNAPLGTLATRLKAAYAIGLLTKEQYEDLEIARKIRNQFAHDWEGVSLNRPDIKSMIGQLHAYTFDGSAISAEPRERLEQSVANVLTELRMQITLHVKHHRRAPFVGFRLTTVNPDSM